MYTSFPKSKVLLLGAACAVALSLGTGVSFANAARTPRTHPSAEVHSPQKKDTVVRVQTSDGDTFHLGIKKAVDFIEAVLPVGDTTSPASSTSSGGEQPSVVAATSSFPSTVSPSPFATSSPVSTTTSSSVSSKMGGAVLPVSLFPGVTSSASTTPIGETVSAYPGAFVWGNPGVTSPYSYATLSPVLTNRLYEIAVFLAGIGALCVSGLLDPILERAPRQMLANHL